MSGEKKPSLNQINKKKLISEGKSIPVCVNPGCGKEVSIRHWSAQGDPSLKTECSTCSRARLKGQELPGVTFHKKHFCENREGGLGFVCPIIPDRYSTLPADIYQMDHVDGNHHNNDPTNVMTLCCICHAVKGREQGDFNAHKVSSRYKKKGNAAAAADEGRKKRRSKKK